jgi:hypothetical protein
MLAQLKQGEEIPVAPLMEQREKEASQIKDGKAPAAALMQQPGAGSQSRQAGRADRQGGCINAPTWGRQTVEQIYPRWIGLRYCRRARRRDPNFDHGPSDATSGLLVVPAAIVAGIVSANLARRNLTKGQKAMALAMVYPEQHSKKSKESLPFSKMRLSQARSVLRHSRDLAESVVKGMWFCPQRAKPPLPSSFHPQWMKPPPCGF